MSHITRTAPAYLLRKTLSRAIRFSVLQRDNFTCQYCGAKAPDVQLEVDHKAPLAHGRTDDMENLVTACFDCNRGQADRLLSETGLEDAPEEQLKNALWEWKMPELALERQEVVMLGGSPLTVACSSGRAYIALRSMAETLGISRQAYLNRIGRQ